MLVLLLPTASSTAVLAPVSSSPKVVVMLVVPVFSSRRLRLADESQYLKRCIYNAKKENSTIVSQSFPDQWRQLVLGPLSKLDRGHRPFSFVLVIDALDECDSDADVSTP